MVKVRIKVKFAEGHRDHITQDTLLRANHLDIVLNITGNIEMLCTGTLKEIIVVRDMMKVRRRGVRILS